MIGPFALDRDRPTITVPTLDLVGMDLVTDDGERVVAEHVGGFVVLTYPDSPTYRRTHVRDDISITIYKGTRP